MGALTVDSRHRSRRFKQTLPILQRFVGLYARLGGSIAAGTDSPQQFVVPGASLHRELELYVGSGLTPAQAIRTATVNAAMLLGIQDRVGVIEAGKAADFLILDGDPLADIRNTRKIADGRQGRHRARDSGFGTRNSGLTRATGADGIGGGNSNPSFRRRPESSRVPLWTPASAGVTKTCFIGQDETHSRRLAAVYCG